MPWTDLTVATERLRLRAFTDDDKDAIVEMRTDPDVKRHLGGPLDADAVQQIRDATLGEQWGVFGVEETASGELIGSVGFVRDRGELELVYEFLPRWWGRGLATEAVGAAIGWAAAHTDDDTVIAVTQTANARSVALLERLGFEQVRTFEEYDAEQGEFRRPLDVPPMGG